MATASYPGPSPESALFGSLKTEGGRGGGLVLRDAPSNLVLRRSLIGFGVLIILLMVVSMALGLWHWRREALYEAEHNLESLSLVLAEQTSRSFEAADLALVFLRGCLESRIRETGLSRFDPYMACEGLSAIHDLEQAEILAQIQTLALIDRAGNAHTLFPPEPSVEHISVSDRAYFRTHAQEADRDLIISGPLKSRATGDWILVLTRRINGPNGAFAGLLLATTPMSQIEEFYQSINPSGGIWVTLLHRDGTLLARHPPYERVMGQSFLEHSAIFTRYLPRIKAAVYRPESAIDGVERIVSFRTLERMPLVVVVSQDRQVVLRIWHQEMPHLVTGTLLASLIVAGLIGLLRQKLLAQEQAARSLAESAQLLETVFNSTHVLVAYLDRKFDFIRVNRAFAERHAGAPENFHGRNHFELFPHAETETLFKRVLHSGEPYFACSRSLPPPGCAIPEGEEQRLWDWSLIPVRGEDKEISGVLLTLLDVTEMRKAAWERDELFRLSQDLMTIGDQEGTLRRFNPAWQRVLGWSEDALTGRKIFELIHPDDQTEAREIIGALSDGSSVTGFEIRLRCRDGSYRWLQWSSSPGYGNTLFAIGRDVTEQREAAAHLAYTIMELTRSNIELERFAELVAHDLKEPTRTIISFAQLLRRHLQNLNIILNDEIEEDLTYLIQGAKRMRSQIEDLLLYAQASATHRQPDLDTQALLAAVLEDFSDWIKQKNATVCVGSLPIVQADAAQLRELFRHLLNNALKFSAPDRPPRLTIQGETRTNDWLFSVSDNGIGIEPEYTEQIFSIFKRLAPSEPQEGTGIGLAICRRIVLRHGGRIWAESVPGEGSQFFFSLPHPETGSTALPGKKNNP